jgi:hypothetical protein
MKPLSPIEIFNNKEQYVHQDIIDIVNQLLGERYSKNNGVTIKQKEIVEKFIERNPNITEKFMLENGYLDFENAYENEGWVVEYNKIKCSGGYIPYYEFFSKDKI